MKNFFLLSLLAVFHVALSAQSATSVANGPWLSPFTWNCMCVPTPGYTVIVNHHVTLNTSFQIPANGSITINSGGALVQDTARDILMTGGTFTNRGTADFRYLLLQTGHLNNGDTLRLKSFANYGNIVNSGIVYQVDSFYNAGKLHNSGTMLAKRFLNSDSLINSGLIAQVDSFYNMGFMQNNDSVNTPTFLTTGTLLNFGGIGGVDSFANTGTLNNFADV